MEKFVFFGFEFWAGYLFDLVHKILNNFLWVIDKLIKREKFKILAINQ